MPSSRYKVQKENALPVTAIHIHEMDIDKRLAAFIIKKGCDIRACWGYCGYYYVYNANNPDGLEYDRFKERYD